MELSPGRLASDLDRIVGFGCQLGTLVILLMLGPMPVSGGVEVKVKVVSKLPSFE